MVPTDAPPPNVDAVNHLLHVARHLIDLVAAADGAAGLQAVRDQVEHALRASFQAAADQ